ncbi:hypothetical protein TWF694_004024 [Orbilia ellipsospora]|uniref:Uncharacterized protein n=1 Tax=Orbilia ellipsospora TaxID=2528407 RepID=A0AAV9WWR4_9PEZI
MAASTTNILTVPDFERPIRILNRDPSRPPSSHSLHRSMSEESLKKITIPISLEAPYFFNNMPPSPAKTPTNRSSEQLPLPMNIAPVTTVAQILPLHDVNVSITNIHETINMSNEDDSSPTSSREDLDDYIQQTADILSSTVKNLQTIDLDEAGGLEQMIAANLRLLRTLKDRHAALDKVEHDYRNDRSRSSGPYTSINRSIYFDTPGFTPPQASRITFKDSIRRNSDDMDGLSTISVEWNDRKEERLAELELKLKSANRAWSEEQNDYLEELEQLQEERRKHKKKAKMERRASIKMERSLSMSHERENRTRASSSRERASSADTKRRLSLGFGAKPMARTNSSGSFIERIFRVGK